MKRSRFNEEPILAILREQEAGMRTAEGASQARGLLQMESPVWRDGGF
jgi:hypothetical protein